MKTPSSVLLPVLLTSFASFGCAEIELESELDDVETAETSDEDALRSLSPTDACIDERQIAFKTNVGACPGVPNWTASKLFSGAAGELDDYCRYDWAGVGAPTPADIGLIGANPNILTHEPDCEIVHEQGTDALTTPYSTTLDSMFRESINAPSSFDLDLPATESSRKPVTVAVIDTTPDSAPAATSIHGGAMVEIVDSINCPVANAACAVETKFVLGMPRTTIGGAPNTTNGGHFGSLGDLAVGIHQAVEDWETANIGAMTPSKLVLNLSLGWDPSSFVSGPAEQAVFAALEAAYCKDAIIVAAAGNSSEMCTTGALLPGAWETAPAPDHARCNQLLPGASAPSTAGYRPLVYAVGGVDHGGAPFSKSRAGGVPRLSATADHVRAGSTTENLTGTSNSSAAVAGAAALLWSYNPDLAPGQLMDALYQGSALTGGSADFHGTGASDLRRRKLDTCAALDEACSLYGTCTTMPLTCLGALPTTTSGALVSAAYSTLPLATTTVEFDPPIVCSDSCGVPHDGYLGDHEGTSTDACPPLVDPVEMFVAPQPTQPSCPNCTLDLGYASDATLIATLDSDWSSETIADLYVTIYDGARFHSYYLGAPSLTSSRWSKIELDDKIPSTVRSATVTMVFASGERSRSALIVD